MQQLNLDKRLGEVLEMLQLMDVSYPWGKRRKKQIDTQQSQCSEDRLGGEPDSIRDMWLSG